MGLTASVMHIFHGEAVYERLDGREYLPGVSTVLSLAGETFTGRKCAKESLESGYPVLSFSIFDSDDFVMELYEGGKKCACVKTHMGETAVRKGIPLLARLVSPEKEAEARLKEIVSADGVETMVGLLEEYFGLPMAAPREMADEIRIERGRAQYDAWKKQKEEMEKALKAVKAELVFEEEGRAFGHHRDGRDLQYSRKTEEGIYDHRRCVPVEYRQGRLHAKIDRFVPNRVLTVGHADGWMIADLWNKRVYLTDGEKRVKAEFSLPCDAIHLFGDGAILCQWMADAAGEIPGYSLICLNADGSERWNIRRAKAARVYAGKESLYLLPAGWSGRMERIDLATGETAAEREIEGDLFMAGERMIACSMGGRISLLDGQLREEMVIQLTEVRRIIVLGRGFWSADGRYVHMSPGSRTIGRLDWQARTAEFMGVPEGFFLDAVDAAGYMAISGGSTILIASPEMKIIAKKRLKGQIVCCRFEEDGLYVLTHAAKTGEWAWGFEDDCTVRSYRLTW